ncbi:MAG: hypothetical protein R3Y32_06720 [Bacillota bacterium]
MSDDCCDDCDGSYLVFASEYPTDSCADPNCTDCTDCESVCVDCSDCDFDVELISSSWVDCADCTDGGSYVVSSRVCTTCSGVGILTNRVTSTCPTCLGTGVGVSYVQCIACGGDGVFVCPVCEGLGYYTSNEENYGCTNCGGNGLRMEGATARAGTGTVDCANCVDGYYTSTRCGTCSGAGTVASWVASDCTVTACNDGIITTTTWVECSTCFGSKGWWIDNDTTYCDYCGYSQLATCPDCYGYGYVTLDGENYGCVTCGGNGLRMNGATAIAGSGTIDCSYCTDSVYYTIDFVCVDYDGYGFDDYSVTVKHGDSIPSILGWSEDTYYYTTTQAGGTTISKDSVAADDMTIYVQILGVSETFTVAYYEVSWSSTSCQYNFASSDILSANSIIVPYDADDLMYGSSFEEYADIYSFLGWTTSDDFYISVDYNDFDSSDVIDFDSYQVTSDLSLFAVYDWTEPAVDNDSFFEGLFDSDSNLFEVLFDFDSSLANYLVYGLIALVVIGILLFVVLMFRK